MTRRATETGHRSEKQSHTIFQRYFRALALAAAAMMAVFPTTARAAEFTPGKIIDKVVPSSAPDQSYALYVPPEFKPERASPVLYILDPRSRGAASAERFRAAAEKYGLVIVSSNRSMSDSSSDPNVDAMRAMWVDTHLKFKIDPQRIYIAGLSGTARAAIYITRNLPPGTITGIIGSGAGYPPDFTPARGDSFLYYGTVGTTDFNFYEMMDLEPKLASAGITNRIEVFDGTHQWPPEQVTIHAFDWMALQAMKAGHQAKDRALIDGIWSDVTDRAKAAEAAGDIIQAHRLWSAAASDFAGLHDTTEAVSKSAAIAGNGAFQAEAKRVEERRKADKSFLDGINLPLSGNEVSVAVSQLQIHPLLKQAKSAETLDERNSAKRVLNEIGVQTSFYLPRRYAAEKRWDRVIFFLGIAAEIDPDDASLYYRRAAAFAQMRDSKKSIADLRLAFAKGFSDVAALEKDPDFDSIRSASEYKAIIGSSPKAAPEATSH